MLKKPVKGILKGNWAAEYKAEKLRLMKYQEGVAFLGGRHGVSKAAARSEDEPSGVGRYYVDIFHQRTNGSMDQFSIRCKVGTSSLSLL